MKTIMGHESHLEVQIGGFATGDMRNIIIDRVKDDVRICDGHHVIKIQFKERKVTGVLVDDIYYWQPE